MASHKSAAVARVDASSSPPLTLLPSSEPERAAERLAGVIDLGSNSWRLVTYRYTPGGAWRRVGQLQEPVRIAEGLAASGRLGSAGIARGLDALELFAWHGRAQGLERADIAAVATSAIRDAANGADFLERARERSGLDIRLLTADEEARYGYLAAVNSTTLTDGLALDLGGGSLQLATVRGREAARFASWPLGAVRVTEAMLPAERALSRKQLKRARELLRRQLDGARAPERGPRVVAMGGAARNLASAALRARGQAPATVQGCSLSLAEVRDLVGTLARRPASRRALPGIKASRADIILGAALVIEAVLERTGAEALEVTRAGLREGVFFASHLLGGASPLVEDVRAASVRNVAALHDPELARAEHVADLALGLHDSLAEAGVIGAAPAERELLRAAALLHASGMSIGYDGHAGHARYVIVNSELYGYSPREVALLAQIVRHHRKGTPGLDDARALARAGDEALVARCALLLRIATQLGSGPLRSVRAARLVPDSGALRLRLRGEDRLARRCVARQAGDDVFRRVFGRRLTVES